MDQRDWGPAVVGSDTMGVPRRRLWGIVVALGITQITSWGSIYYVFSLLLTHLQSELQGSRPIIVGAFSVALLVSGLLAPWVGHWIDRRGGRRLMTIGSIAGGVGLILLGQVHSVGALYAVWILLGFAMAATLYEPAFAVVTRAFASDYRLAITILTLFGGFASTVFWPLAQVLIDRFGWREAVAILGLINFALCVPLHAFVLPRASDGSSSATEPSTATRSRNLREVLAERSFYLLCGAFTANALVLSAVAVHLLAMLVGKGLTPLQAALVGAMVGPMQVLGRFVEMLLGGRFRASQVGLVSLTMLPISLVLLQLLPPVLAVFVVFAFFFGAGNGVTTIVRGTIPVEAFGRTHYGVVNGALAAPVLIAKASGPVVAALVWSLSASYDSLAWVLAAVAAVAVLLFIPIVRSHAALPAPRAAE